MKVVTVEQGDLAACITHAKSDRIVITRGGRPIALILGLEGLDQEQVRLGMSDEFWHMIDERRQDMTMTRAEVERKVQETSSKRQ
jgi:antitoxin (DNA-binding transcriptional repressor) of toxin-antitoxin stability system